MELDGILSAASSKLGLPQELSIASKRLFAGHSKTIIQLIGDRVDGHDATTNAATIDQASLLAVLFLGHLSITSQTSANQDTSRPFCFPLSGAYTALGVSRDAFIRALAHLASQLPPTESASGMAQTVLHKFELTSRLAAIYKRVFDLSILEATSNIGHDSKAQSLSQQLAFGWILFLWCKESTSNADISTCAYLLSGLLKVLMDSLFPADIVARYSLPWFCDQVSQLVNFHIPQESVLSLIHQNLEHLKSQIAMPRLYVITERREIYLRDIKTTAGLKELEGKLLGSIHRLGQSSSLFEDSTDLYAFLSPLVGNDSHRALQQYHDTHHVYNGNDTAPQLLGLVEWIQEAGKLDANLTQSNRVVIDSLDSLLMQAMIEELDKCVSNQDVTQTCSAEVIDQAKRIYYRLLNQLITMEVGNASGGLVKIIQNKSFHRTLFGFSLDVLLSCKGIEAFPIIYQQLRVTAYEYVKVFDIIPRIDPELHAIFGKKLASEEDITLLELIWSSEGDFIQVLERCKSNPFASPIPNKSHSTDDASLSALFNSPRPRAPVVDTHQNASIKAPESPARISAMPRATKILLQKILNCGYHRLRILCQDLGLVDLFLKIQHTFQTAVTNYSHALLPNRHLDQVIVCSIYGVAKADQVEDIKFKDIIESYRSLPYSSQRVFQTIPPLHPSQPPINIIGYYNELFVPQMKMHLLHNLSGRDEASLLPHMSPSSPLRVGRNIYVSPYRGPRPNGKEPSLHAPIFRMSPSPGQPQAVYTSNSLSFELGKSPVKDLMQINSRVNQRSQKLDFEEIASSDVQAGVGALTRLSSSPRRSENSLDTSHRNKRHRPDSPNHTAVNRNDSPGYTFHSPRKQLSYE
eukprot:TRINITY_DN12557_c0_g1_i1.p1 TRINITY_DN12557_c0_g1~~TRINITY_DN12557_c0_g1_i1.p1  ORF type:complete len:862 (+),score=130.05 TRINITY_DN12557_c0_g1_i1:45-2630(+)